jgi:cytoskeleton protein RodZ
MALLVLAALAVGISSYLSEGQNPLPFGTQSTATDEPAPAETVVQPVTEAEAQSAETEVAGETAVQIQNAEPELVSVTDEPVTNDLGEAAVGEPAAVQEAVPETSGTNMEGGEEDRVAQNDTDSGAGDSVEAETAVAVPEAATAEPESATDGQETVADVAELIMTFNGDCWVQVSDAQGNRLASTLQREGDELRLDGTAPMNVIVGAMTAVESILFRGEPVDLDNIRTVNNRAQFTLEP